MSPPNTVTLLRILLTPIFLGLLFSGDSFDKQFALAIFTIAAITDWYDGFIARRYGYVSRFGKFFDPIADKFLTSAGFISFYFLGYAELWMVIAISVRDVLITLLRMIAELKNKQFDTSNLAKTKTVVQLATIYLILIFDVVNSIPFYFNLFGTVVNSILNRNVIDLLMWLSTLLTLFTGISYLIKNKKTVSLILK